MSPLKGDLQAELLWNYVLNGTFIQIPGAAFKNSGGGRPDTVRNLQFELTNRINGASENWHQLMSISEENRASLAYVDGRETGPSTKTWCGGFAYIT
jgi:hypothetical protein